MKRENNSFLMENTLAVICSISAGFGLFLFTTWLETTIGGGILINAFIEEAAKLSLFLAALLLFSLRVKEKEIFYLFIPFFSICFYGIAENIIYFLRFPDTFIYFRLLYSYPVHLNTALLYLIFLSDKRLLPFTPLLFISTTFYHYGLNVLVLLIEESVLFFLMCTVNVSLFFLFVNLVNNCIFLRRALLDRR
ncbi:MAG: hypothetical protein DRP87_07040 [Spirochaetes bacterium]|nr:MAG: hypothetical protein DRP87_07040 [Spirochaetota bacterium]